MDSSGLSILNASASRLHGPGLLHQLVHPPSPAMALDYLGNSQRLSLTYQQLHDAADALAARIARYRTGSTPTETHQFVVPVLIHQSPLLYISLLAILKAGGAFCPLNIDAPPERVRFILQDVSAAVVLVSAELASELPNDVDASILVADTEDQDEDHLEDGNIELTDASPERRIPTPDDLAYVMYTSGSTGTPKGVGISHVAATQALLAHDKHIPSFSRFLQFAAPTFDVSVFEIFFPLFRGSTLVSVRRAEMLNDLPSVLRSMDIDACELTPTVAGSLLRKRENAPNLKLLLTIGEMLNAPVVEEFGGDEERPSMLWAMYGPTEATIHCTLQPAFSSSSSTGNIGIPLDTVSCFVIETTESGDGNSEPKILPLGEVGELAVGGYQLATGYINRPEQTDSVFISSPYGRIYRTGDKARLLPDGTLECLGRLSDGQVKLRGQRLELGEVEQAVLRTSGCHSAVAAVVNAILVVFCAVDSGVLEENVLGRCKDWLPQYMVPGEVVLMEEFPRLPSGKVDRKRLKADYEMQKSKMTGDPTDLPTNEFEAEIIRIVSEILDISVHKSTTLAAAGLDSLKAIKLASKLREFEFDLTSTQVLAMRTVADILFAARALPTGNSNRFDLKEISFKAQLEELCQESASIQDLKELIEELYPCTPLQSAMLAETAQNPSAYCNEIELEAPSNFTVEDISNAFYKLMSQNEILRAGFTTWKGQFVQVVFREPPESQISIVDRLHAQDSMYGAEDYLKPLHVQIQESNQTNGPRILIQIHHSIYDGWSMDSLLRDLSGILIGEDIASRPGFSKITRFYYNHLTQEVDDAARVWWTKHLQGWNKVPFPKVQSRPTKTSQIFSVQRQMRISRQQVDDGVAKVGCSPQVLFQASLSLLWSGVLGLPDVVIGSVTSGRTIPIAGIERIIGPCIASLPLRTDLSSMDTTAALLHNLHSANRDIMKHCVLSLAEIKKLAGLKPGESFYDVLFVYQESLESHMRRQNLIKETQHLDRLETPLLFEVEPVDDGFTLQVTYQASKFSRDVIERFYEQFETLSLSILENPDLDVRATQKVIENTPSVFNTLPEVYTEVSDLARGFEEAASKDPKRDALRFAESLSMDQTTTMSFEQLNGDANQVAWHLQELGAKAGQVIAIIMDKSPLLYTSILGILKTGCGYLPLLPSTPFARVKDILEQSQVQHCLVDEKSSTSFASIPAVHFVNLGNARLAELSRKNLSVLPDPSRIAYVIYTSGTTGVPKGVAVTQGNIMANISHLESLYPSRVSPRPRLLQSCSQAFDVSVFEIFFTWITGMCLCSGMNDTLFEDLELAIRKLGVTHLSMTPTVASLIDPRTVPDVEFLVTSGEPMTQKVLDSWGERLWQGYGPSETTNICTVKPMKAGDHIEHLGYALRGTSTFVLFADSLEIAPIGWVGELCFGGDQVAQGYLNMPKLTSEKFIDHPRYGRLYRTGDLGRMLPDGTLVILGRMDGQVKLRGQRIETSEVNKVATSIDLVRSAVTLLVRRDPDAQDQLASFYVPTGSTGHFKELEPKPELHQTLLAVLQSRLPTYMVPSYLIPVSSIPLTSSGKVDQRLLQASFRRFGLSYLESVVSSRQDIDSSSDWSSTETLLAEVISSATGTPRQDFGRWTPFAMLGIDSVSAIHLARNINSKLNARVAVSDILKYQSIAQLSRHLLDLQGSHPDKPQQKFFPGSFISNVTERFAKVSLEVENVLPCTPLQEAMLSRGQSSYYNRTLLRLHTEPEEMKSYWMTMIHRHEILRACFVTTEDVNKAIAQVILKRCNIPWLTFDIHGPSFDVASLEHLNNLPDPVNSYRPPISLALFRYRGSVFLSFICHHALYDGVAMGNLWAEVECLARGEQLPDPVPYSPFLQAAMDLPEDVEDFWSTQFNAYRPSSLFAQNSGREIDQSTHSTSLEIPLDELHTRIRSLGISLLSLCQASWANVLAMAHRHADVCFGNVVSGRTLNIDGLDRLVAPCFNTLPIRANFAPQASNMDVLEYFQTLNTSMMPYEFTPLRLTQRKANRIGRHLFDTLLLLQKPLQDIDKNIWTLEEDSGDMDIPLVCEVVPCPSLNSVVVNIHRDMSSITVETATVMADTFKFMLRTILGSPNATILDRSKLPSALSSGLDVLHPRQEKVDTAEFSTDEDKDWSEAEEQVRQVLSELAQVPASRIKLSTTIFQLGLDSINAVQVASMLREKGFNITASDVIECPTCSKIARRLLESSMKRNTEEVSSYDFDKFSNEVSFQLKDILPKEGIEAILPCTPVQSAMLASFIQSDGDHYLNAIKYEVDDGINAQSLKTAWHSLSARHPMLRTFFCPIQHRGSSFAMIRFGPKSFDLPVEIIDDAEREHFDLRIRRREMGKLLQMSPRNLPWKVIIGHTDGRLTMNIFIHHALYDAQSLHLIMGELASSLHGGQTCQFTGVEKALTTIIHASSEGEDEKQYWEAKKSQMVVNKFPIMTPLRVESRTVLSDTVMSSLSVRQLQQATQMSNISIQAVIQAAWTRVLSSYLGEKSVVFGVALSGRTTDETKDAPIPCVNTVPIVASNMESNAELTEYMMDYNQGLHKHQFSPLHQVQRWLGHPADAIFDTLLAYQKMDDVGSTKTPWRLVDDEAKVEYPVSLEIEPTADDGICLRITYYNDILPQGQAQLILRQFDSCMKNLACNPSGHEDDMYVRAPDVFSILPAASPSIPAPVTLLHQFVEREALSNPSKLALEYVCEWKNGKPVPERWTYHELNCMGDKVANLIREVAPPRSIVAIHFEKCPEAYFSILGILKAGCSFVALDPTAPKARKQFILQDSGAPCLLTKNAEALDFEVETTTLQIDEKSLKTLNEGSHESQPGILPSDTCYCLYTSGTTGTPKGCEITHENAVQAMMAFQELFRGHWESDSRWLQFAALHFDVSVLEQYWSWSVGITVVAAPKDFILDDLTAFINRLDITHIDLTPSLARLTHPDEVPSLCRGVFITGGEQLKQEILDLWGPKAVIYNAYGPTEATIGVTMYQRVPVTGRPSNIGKQFPNVGSYVFRQGTEIPVLRGGVGELCVSGKLVGKGYLNRPELTQERFPTLSEFGERIYRTGDLVRMLHDGCFDFLGRADDQVKLRGQRLEIAEINHAIRTGVDEIEDVATIVTRHGVSGKDVLVSFIVERTSREKDLLVQPDIHSLGAKAKEACRMKLPGYMVPTYILLLPYIPLSPNNKAEVKELKKLFEQLSQQELMELSRAAATPTSAASTATMVKLIAALAEFSDTKPEEIDASASIFDLGVDSITSLRLSSLLKSRGFPAAAPSILLKYPIIGELAGALTKTTANQHEKLVQESRQTIQAFSHRYRAAVCRDLRVKPAEIEYIAPCSPLQQGIISRSMTSETGDLYFNTFELEVLDDAPPDRVRAAWSQLVQSEAILRTAFVPTTDGFIQVALRNGQIRWQDLSFDDEDQYQTYLQRSKREWTQQNASVITHPLMVSLIETPAARRLVINVFHASYDGNSFELMLQKACAFYHQEEPLSSPPFIDALVHGPLWKYDSCRPFWTEHLRDSFFKPIPQLRDPESEIKGVEVTRVLPSTSLEAVRSAQNVTMQAVVLALWTSVLRNIILSPVTMGVIVSGRAIELPNAANIIGPLFNTVPFFSKSLHGASWASLIQRCHEYNTALLEFQHVPLKNIQKWCTGGKQLFDNLFAFQIETPGTQDQPWKLTNSGSTPDYPLALEVTYYRGDSLRFTLAAQSHIADDVRLQEILDQMEEAISSMTTDPTQSISAQTEEDISLGLAEAQEPGIPATQAGHFEWTKKALQIQKEIAVLADVASGEVREAVTILELGLDSIDIIKLSAKLKKQSIMLTPSQIMRCQTIRGMVSALDETSVTQLDSDNGVKALQGTKAQLWKHLDQRGVIMKNVETVLPPTPLQESMVAGMVQTDFESYFNHDILEIREDLDLDKFKQAWVNVIERLPVLRTTFFEIDDDKIDVAYCQVVWKELAVSHEEIELHDPSEFQSIIDKAKAKARQGGATKDVLQLQFLTLSSRKFLVLSMAHALYDGWSLSLLFQHLHAAYNNEEMQQASPEGFLSRISQVEVLESKEFWTQYLEGATPTLAKRHKENNQNAAAGLQRREIPSRLSFSDVMGFCKQQSISLQVLCQACWAIVLARQLGLLDITFGVVVSGRDFDGAEDLVFPTMNTIALRCILHGSPVTFLRYLEENMSEIREHQHYPLRKAQLAANTQGSNLFNTLFILQRSPEASTSTPMVQSIEGSSSTEYPICIEAEASQSSLVWRIAVQPQYSFNRRDPEDLLSEVDAVMHFLTTSSDSDILSFDDQGVSICGMAPTATPSSDTTEEGICSGRSTQEDDNWTETSSLIRKVLSQVSNVPIESIQLSDTLYHLGLDSISAIKVSSQLRRNMINLRPQHLIRATSIAEMADIADQQRHEVGQAHPEHSVWTLPKDLQVQSILESLGLSQTDFELLPALPMQVYMLSAWQIAEGSVFYPTFRYTMDASLELNTIEAAWEKLVAESPMLRTVFIATTSKDVPFLQCILKNFKSPLSLSTPRREPSYNPSPLVEASVMRGQERWIFQLKIHHALYDGVSLPAMIQRFSELLGEVKPNVIASDTSKWTSFCTSHLSNSNRQSRKEFWSSYLNGCRDTTPTLDSAADVRSRVSVLRKSAMPDMALLQEKAIKHGISIQSLFLAAYAKVLAASSSATPRDHVVFGIYLANRAADHDLPTTFPALNLVPLKVDAPQSRPLTSIAKEIQDDIHKISSPELSAVGLWEIKAWTGMTIDSFVNFLSLPQEPDDSADSVHKLVPLEQTEAFDVDESSPLPDLPWLNQNPVKTDFPLALDIEASVHNSRLDIGVFGSQQRVSSEEAEQLISELVACLSQDR